MASNRGSNGAAARKIHPGAGRRQALAFPKGRQVDAGSQEAIRALLGEGPFQRDLLIEYLHRIQDSQGHLSAGHLQALAEAMKLPMAEIFEVASFYAHFDIVLDGEAAPAPLTVRVCDSLTCEMMGAEALLAELPARLGSGVRVVRAPCMGRCDCAPVAEVGHRHVDHATLDNLAQTAESGDHHPVLPDYTGYEAYVADGGYQTLRACYEGRHEADDLVAKLEDSQLKGKGGAGFPAGLKWKILRQQPKPRLFAINADEGEPGTFKDRFYLESDPHRFLEGMLIAAWATEVETCYIYLRDEYPAVRAILLKEIARIEAEGLTGGCRVELRRGAGAYICGEESAMIESIEGKRGLPRHKPPYPSEAGLFGLPTLTHNVETVFWLRDI
nr:NAD(P)H-dependent oxidoreductase subunit E [Kiloniellales bacterium]